MPILELHNVSKSFVLRTDQPRSFQELMVGLWRRPRTRTRERYWALRNLSFQVEAGGSLALIGSNGSGKSTALKLISKILEPTSGDIAVKGQVAALLELGAGFHPDLSGRENVYLNASILGRSRAQIRRQFDAIVSFAELERFIDTPAKNYSSGMLVRLGFAVATAFRPDILLIDEVLAVGDQAFQDRCLHRILEIQEAGATIIVVTHDMTAVEKFCQHAIWLDQGRECAQGPVDDVISAYLHHLWTGEQQKKSPFARKQVDPCIDSLPAGPNRHDEPRLPDRAIAPKPHEARWGSGEVQIEKAEILGADRLATSVFHTGDPFVVRMWYRSEAVVQHPAFGISIYDALGYRVNGPNTVWSKAPVDAVCGAGFVDYIVDRLPLLPGTYELTVAVYDRYVSRPYDHWHRMADFAVIAGQLERQDGSVYIECRWEHHDG